MKWEIEYYSEMVQAGINNWPVGIRAYYAKTHKTPSKEIAVARKRLMEVTHENKKSHEQMIAEWRNDPAFQEAYDALENDFALFDELINARQAAGLTQEAVAKRMGTKVPAISRIETGRHSPTVATLRRYAIACGKRLEIRLVP